MKYEELVQALRICGKGSCVDCDRQRQDKCLKRHWNNEDLIDGMLCEAAAAIEELQSILTEADKKQSYQHDYICELVAEKEELQATIELMKLNMPDFFPDANKVVLPKMEVQE